MDIEKVVSYLNLATRGCEKHSVETVLEFRFLPGLARHSAVVLPGDSGVTLPDEAQVRSPGAHKGSRAEP